MLGGQPPLVSESLTKSKRITIIASKMISWQEVRDRLQNVWTTPAMALIRATPMASRLQSIFYTKRQKGMRVVPPRSSR